jgi:hypothetical protein
LLSNVGRPNVVSAWISGGRKAPPKIEDLRDFTLAWKAWWKSLQPSTRVSSRSKLQRKIGPDDSWESLQKNGINGFFTIVASLSWWFAEAKTDAQIKDFNYFAADILWAQEQIISKLCGLSETEGD